MALFLSTTVNKVDKKGRVSVPAPFRSALANQSFAGIVAFPSPELSAIDACGIDRMEALSASLDEPDQYSPEELDLAQLIFAQAEQLAFDDTGRIVLPKPLGSRAHITDEVLFAGLGPTFQMWQPQHYETHRRDTLKQTESKGISLRLRPIPRGKNSSGGGS